MKKIILNITMATALFCATSCDSYFDINSDPNNPTAVDYTTLVPHAQRYGAYTFNNGVLGTGLMGYVHQLTSRESDDSYGWTGSTWAINNGIYYMYVPTMQNLELALAQATAADDKFNMGMLKTMKVYYYSQYVDLFGDSPYSEACKKDDGIVFPTYDKDSEIYDSLFELLDEAIENLTGAGNGGTYDLIYGGKSEYWRKAAKSLKFKLLTQVRKVESVASQINSLLSEGDLISTPAETFAFYYGNTMTPNDRHPGFTDSYEATQKGLFVSPFFFEVMMGIQPVLNGIEDPRIPYYFCNQLTATAASEVMSEYRYKGFNSIYFASKGMYRNVSRENDLTVMGIYPVGGLYDDGNGGQIGVGKPRNSAATGAGVQKYITPADVLYLKAELIQAGVITGNLEETFREALVMSMKMVDYVVSVSKASAVAVPTLADSDLANTYIDRVMTRFSAASSAGKLELIMTQKWIQGFGSPVDSYTDYRRTGYPLFFDAQNVSFVTVPEDGYPQADKDKWGIEKLSDIPVSCAMDYPRSLPYSNDDLSVNPNAPKQKTNLGNQRIFWDN